MIAMMRQAGIPAFEDDGAWETCLSALVLALEPKCRAYRFMEALPVNRRRYSQEDVLDILARLGYFSQQVEISVNDLDHRLFPSLFVKEDGTPLILIEREGPLLKIFRNGTLAYVRPSQLADTSGHAIVFQRYDENKPSTSKFMRAGTNYGWFRALMGRFYGTFAQILCAGLVINLISLTAPLMIMLVYNRVIATGAVDALPMIVAGMVIATIFEFSLRVSRSRGLSWIAARMDNIVGNRIFSHLIGLPPAMIERASVASQIARIKTFESIRDFFCGSVFLSMIELPFVFLAAFAIYMIAGPLVLVPVLTSALYAGLFYLIYKRVKTSIRLAAKTSTARQQFTIESFEKLRGIRAYGLKKVWHNKFRDLSGKEMFAHFHLNYLGMFGETLAHALTIISAVLTISFGVQMIWSGAIGTGALVAVMILVWRVITPFYSLCTMIPRMEQIRHSIIQVNTLMDIETEQQLSKSSATLPALRGQVAFSGVSIKYSETIDPAVFGLDLDARAGDFIGITGENGSGKSSILKLVKCLYAPSQGAVRIDGFDIRQLDALALRKQIGYIPQHHDYFHGSILENLRLCNPVATRGDIDLALDMADATAEISTLPAGIETIISRYAAENISPDLLTRLSLARLYLHTSPILLIDEIPNAILSGRAGRNLRDYIARCKGKRTCFMVTYREDFLKMADTLVFLRKGEAPLVGDTEQMIAEIMEAA